MKFLCAAFQLWVLLIFTFELRAAEKSEVSARAIPWEQLGAEAQKQCSGESVAITPTAEGALLRSAFQKLEGEVTGEGLWLSSTANAAGRSERFRVLATAVGRAGAKSQTLPVCGTVIATAEAASFVRAGLLEEYRVSADGVRQDFVVLQRPEGTGELRVTLGVTGARVDQADYGIKLTLPQSGREIGYSRLQVTDATGRELRAKLEVSAMDCIVVSVADASATYPVRVDPTFSDADWVSMNPGILGTNGTVYAMVIDGGGNIYAGGNFTTAGTISASNIAKWDGSVWSVLGSGTNGAVTALAVSGTDLYAGGIFTTAGGVTTNHIAKWNGSVWAGLGTGTDGSVSALAVSGGTLYAGGTFVTAGGVSASHIAQWDGTVWSALGAGRSDTVYALAFLNGSLYVGGQFSGCIARWDGSAWNVLGAGITGTAVYALAVSGSTLYAGGNISSSLITRLNNIGQWDGTTWSKVGVTGVTFEVRSLAVNGTDLYVGGRPSSGSALSKWDGSSWSTPGGTAMGSNMGSGSYSVSTMVFSGTDLYVGGAFTMAGGKSAMNVAKWDGIIWTPLHLGINGPVYSLVFSGSNLYVGGNFSMAGGGRAGNIAKWDGSTWTTLGTGMDGTVYALLVNGTEVYAAGNFTNAGGVAANNIAKWDGAVWSAMGPGLDGNAYKNVRALAMVGPNLYAAGSFTNGANPSASCIARWDGSSWSSLGAGVGGSSPFVDALAVSGTDLYVGGSFTSAGGVEVTNLARWDGATWNALGSGFSPIYVAALVASGTRLYAASSSLISVWDGNSWSAIPAGDIQSISSMVVSGTNLYVGGGISGDGFGAVGKWDGNSWTKLTVGSVNDLMLYGVLPWVQTLTVDSNNRLFIGGYGFNTVGDGVISPYLAQANLPTPTPDIAVTQTTVLSDGTGGVDFGPVVAGSGSAVRTFTLTNPGDAELSGLSVSLDGVNNADFSVSAFSRTHFVPGESVTFTVTYAPGALTAGSSAGLHIVSNVGGSKSPFDISLSGMGVTANQGWQQQYFGVITGAGNAAPGADPNHNGIPNLVEYALGGDPAGVSAGTGVLPGSKVDATGNRLQLSFNRYPNRNDITLIVQAADDLAGPWADLAQSVNGAAFSVITPGASIIESALGSPRAVSVSDLYQTSDLAHPRRFMRLKVSQ